MGIAAVNDGGFLNLIFVHAVTLSFRTDVYRKITKNICDALANVAIIEYNNNAS